MNKHWEFINRHGDHDKHWWRFRYSAPSAHWRPTGIMLETNGGGYDESSRSFNLLNVSVFGHNLGLILPPLLKPVTEQKFYHADGHDEPRSYTETYRRDFGFRHADGAMTFHFGKQVNEWPGCKSLTCFYPWRETQHIRRSLYDETGEHFCIIPERRGLGYQTNWKADKALEESCPVRFFMFAEDDGEIHVAVCRIEEREWRHGRGIWRWLLAWKRNLVQRSLCIEYSGEVGRRKGSWKGGTIGTSIRTEKGELPIEAFRRHCREEKLHYIADVSKRVIAGLGADRRLDARLYLETVTRAGVSDQLMHVSNDFYRNALTPIYDNHSNMVRAYPTRAVQATMHGVIIPDHGRDDHWHVHAPGFRAEVSGMMADGQVEGQWGSPMVIKEVSDEEFERMVQGAAADGTVNAAMHEEFEARGLDTAFIPTTGDNSHD